MRTLLFTITLLTLAGCSYDQQLIGDPVEVTGKVQLPDGKPARDVKINFFPMDKGNQSFGVVAADGSFKAKVVPAKYMFTFEPIGNRIAAFKAIPTKFHDVNAENTVDYSTEKNATISLK